MFIELHNRLHTSGARTCTFIIVYSQRSSWPANLPLSARPVARRHRVVYQSDIDDRRTSTPYAKDCLKDVVLMSELDGFV